MECDENAEVAYVDHVRTWIPILIELRHIQYQGETLPFPLVLAFHLVLGKFHIYPNRAETE